VGRSPEHDQDLKFCEWSFDSVDKLERAGRLAPDIAEATRAYVAGHVLKAHIYENPKVYRALRKEDDAGDNIIDMLRDKVGGSFDESSGASEQRQVEAFGAFIRTAADVGFAENVITPLQYEDLMSWAAPKETQSVRQAVLVPPKDDGGPREIDGDVLVPASDEQRDEVALQLWMQRQGMGRPNAPAPEPPVTGENEGRASDWSTSRLEKYFAQRDREQGIFHPNMSEPQSEPRGPIVLDNSGFDERPYNPISDE
jgi:hypothetical protein